VALADYYERAALAASQIIAGFEPDLFRRTLEDANVGIAIDRDAASSDEGRTLAELSIRLLARLYPSLEVRAELSSEGERLEQLARAINPRVEFKGGAQIGIAIGRGGIGFNTTCFAGSDGWDALLSVSEPMGTGHSPNPLGASAAACLASASANPMRTFRPAMSFKSFAGSPARATNSAVSLVDPSIPDNSHTGRALSEAFCAASITRDC